VVVDLPRLVVLVGWGCAGAPSAPPDTGTTAITTSTGLGCDNPQPVLLASGQPSGFLRCLDGSMHRQSVVPPGPSSSITEAACDAAAYPGIPCAVDADCTARPNGLCLLADGDGALCDCDYACESDADCDPGTICMPSEVWDHLPSYARCAEAACLTDADCPSGECGVGLRDSGCGATASLACRTAADACRVDADCAGDRCGWETNHDWYCYQADCDR
jgi:hypothetical protein